MPRRRGAGSKPAHENTRSPEAHLQSVDSSRLENAFGDVFVGLTVTPGDDSLNALKRNLREKGYRVLDLTDNETAKLHLRHMIGGRQPDDIGEEIVFRVEFPERPGSLLQFLNALGNEFSITLFHYRNHGAAYGRILVGMQVPPGKRAQLRKALLRLGYPFREESDNPAYLEYLGRLNRD